MTRISRPSYHSRRGGGPALSPFRYICKYCGKPDLAWGVVGEHRRLFETHDVMHECHRNAKKQSTCDDFADFEIPIEFY